MRKEKRIPFIPPTKPLFVAKALSQQIDWGVKLINAPSVWTETQGEGVKVAVLDTGYTSHTDLKDNVKGYANFTDSQDFVDKNGHSTHVGGIIAATNNSTGVVGVAPKAEVYTVKVLGDNGSGSFEWIARGIEWCIENKIDVISMSLGSAYPSPRIHEAVKKAYNVNIPLVCATGNEYSSTVCYPANYSETIAVGAIAKDKTKAGFSNWGDSVDVAAPGVSIYSTYLNNTYAVLSGTSMATPAISGVVALIISKHRKSGGKTPAETVDQIKEHLFRLCDDLGEVGRDDFYGYGVPNLTKFSQNNFKPEKPKRGFLRKLICFIRRLFKRSCCSEE